MSKHNKLFGAAIATLLILALGLTLPAWSRDFALATSSKPEAFTELYFNNIRTLPSTVEKGKPNTLHFTVVNHENASTTYTYRISIIENDHTRTTTGAITIAAEKSASLPVTIAPTGAGDNIELVIELPAQHQQLHLRVKS